MNVNDYILILVPDQMPATVRIMTAAEIICEADRKYPDHFRYFRLSHVEAVDIVADLHDADSHDQAAALHRALAATAGDIVEYSEDGVGNPVYVVAADAPSELEVAVEALLHDMHGGECVPISAYADTLANWRRRADKHDHQAHRVVAQLEKLRDQVTAEVED